MIATGSDPVIPPVPGLDELDGVWTNREVTALTEVPRRLLVLGGGPVGVEMAQAVRRLGASVALVEGTDHVLPRGPPLGDALATALAADGIELHLGEHASRVRREDDEYVLEFDGATSCAATACSWRPAAPRVPMVAAWTRLAWSRPAQGPRRRADARDGRRVGDRRRDRRMAAHVHRASTRAAWRRRTSSAATGSPTTTPSRGGLHRSAGSGRRRAARCCPPRSPWRRCRALHLHTRVRGEPGFMTLLIGRRAAHRRAMRSGPEAGEWLQQATVAIRARAARGVVRRDPAVPELLGGVPGDAERPRGPHRRRCSENRPDPRRSI